MNCPDNFNWCGKWERCLLEEGYSPFAYLLVPLALSLFTLLQLLPIPLLISELAFQGFYHWLRTTCSPGSSQVLYTRFGTAEVLNSKN